MKRLKIAIVYGNNPNYNKDAFKYFILSLNKVQTTYEFFFPDLNTYPFVEGVCDFESSVEILVAFIQKREIETDFSIGIITSSFNNNYFFNGGDDTAVITTDVWDKLFSPPSLFEYLMHSIYCCLLYSQKTPPDWEVTKEALKIGIESHSDTRGCIADFTSNKYDDRIDIALGYICEQHKEEIRIVFGEKYLTEATNILERKWIGNIDEKGSVAYNLKHIFKFDINKDSGFNKTTWDKCQEKFYEIPGDITGEVLKILLTAIITYVLVKYGMQAK